MVLTTISSRPPARIMSVFGLRGDGKQEIYLEWPNPVCKYSTLSTTRPIQLCCAVKFISVIEASRQLLVSLLRLRIDLLLMISMIRLLGIECAHYVDDLLPYAPPCSCWDYGSYSVSLWHLPLINSCISWNTNYWKGQEATESNRNHWTEAINYTCMWASN